MTASMPHVTNLTPGSESEQPSESNPLCLDGGARDGAHGVRLAAARLPVREHRAVDPLQRAAHDGLRRRRVY